MDMVQLTVALLAALALSHMGAASPASAREGWVNPARAKVVLRADPSPVAPARALVYRGETLRVVAAAQVAARDWQRVATDGRSGWLLRADTRPARAPKPSRRTCTARAVGSPTHGRLLCGRQLRAQGTGFRTWDFPLSRSPNRPERRWGTVKLISRIEWVARRWQARHPLDARLLVGDLARPRGGPFTARFGGIGHASHQNGLDVDLYYPRTDGREREAFRPSQVDRRRARELIALIKRTRPQLMFVGCRVGIPATGRVRHLCSAHENHVHVRYRP